jgi:signal transduction histidine kinase
VGPRDRIATALHSARRTLDQPVAIDAGLTILVLVLSLFLGGLPRNNLQSWTTAAALVTLLIRHRAPEITFTIGLLATLTHLAAGHEPIPADATCLIGLYTVAADRHRRTSLATLAVALATAAAWNLHAHYTDQANSIVVAVHRDGTVTPISPPHLTQATLNQIAKQITGFPGAHLAQTGPQGIQVTIDHASPVTTWGGFWLTAVIMLIAWSTGTATRRRHAHLTTLHQRATELEHQRDTQARLAVLDERARISRELHDIVAHGLSVVVLQAQGGAAALQHHPENTRQALDAIVTTSRNALTETRRLLGALSDDNTTQWAPQPDLDQLPQLCDQVAATGLPINLHIHGHPHPPPAAIALAAYRIIQEALTNILKHAGQPATTVRLHYQPTQLAIDITNNPGQPQHHNTTTHGTGLRGMQERATVLGGTFHAGPQPDGGFAVHATLPLEEPPP